MAAGPVPFRGLRIRAIAALFCAVLGRFFRRSLRLLEVACLAVAEVLPGAICLLAAYVGRPEADGAAQRAGRRVLLPFCLPVQPLRPPEVL